MILIDRGAQYKLSAIARGNGVGFFHRRAGCPQRALGDRVDCIAISRIYEQELNYYDPTMKYANEAEQFASYIRYNKT